MKISKKRLERWINQGERILETTDVETMLKENFSKEAPSIIKMAIHSFLKNQGGEVWIDLTNGEITDTEPQDGDLLFKINPNYLQVNFWNGYTDLITEQECDLLLEKYPLTANWLDQNQLASIGVSLEKRLFDYIMTYLDLFNYEPRKTYFKKELKKSTDRFCVKL